MNDNITIAESSRVDGRIFIKPDYDVDSVVIEGEDIDELIEKLQEHQDQ